MPEPVVYDIQAPGLERMIEMMGLATSGAAKMEASIKAMSDAARAFSMAQKSASSEQSRGQTSVDRAAVAAEKAAQKAAAAAEKRAEAERRAAAAMEAAASRAELTASRMAAEGSRAYETLLNVGGQYGQMIRDGVKETSELAKAWRAGLSPAERTALNLAKMSAATDETTSKTVSFSLATVEASKKLEDQIRRQDENVGANNKLSRSLSKIIQEQTDAITVNLHAIDVYGAQTDALKESAKGYDETAKKLDSLEKAMSSLGIPGAGLIGTAKNINESLKNMAETGSPAQASLLKVGIAVGSVGAAGAAAVAGVAAIGAAIVATTAQAADWNKELEKVGLSIEQAPLERYAASIGSVGSVVKAMGVQIAATFGPAIEGAATRIAALGLAGIDAFKNLRQGEDVMTRLARVAATVLVEAFTLPITAFQKLTSAMAEPFRLLENVPGTIGLTAKALGLMGTATQAVGGSLDAWKTEQVDAVTASIAMLGRDAMAPLVAITDDYMAQASELVSRQTAVNAAAREGATAVKAQTAAVQELTIAARDSITTIGETVPSAFREAQQATSGITDEMIKQSNDAANAIAANLAAAAERGRQSWSSSFSSIGDSAGKLSSLIIGYSHKQGDAAMKAAVVAFRVQQAASSASVVVSTYQAFMQALATMPPPASYVAAGAAIAAGVSSLAAIWMQAPPSANGGATSISAPSVGAAGGTSAATGTKSMPAFKAEQMNEVTGSTVGGKVDTSGLSVQPTVQVTDAYIAPSSSSMQIRTTPGDAVSIERGGAKADRDGAMLRLLQTLIDESRSQGRIMMDMISELQMSRHRREVAIGGVY